MRFPCSASCWPCLKKGENEVSVLLVGKSFVAEMLVQNLLEIVHD